MVEQLVITVDSGLAVVIIFIVVLDLRIGQDDEPIIFVRTSIDLRHRGDRVVEHPHNFHANLDDPPIARGRDTVFHHVIQLHLHTGRESDYRRRCVDYARATPPI